MWAPFVTFVLLFTAGSTALASTNTSSLTLLFQNNLNATDDANHVGAILLDPTDYKSGVAQCAALNESPLPWATVQAYKDDFQQQFSYLAYSGAVSAPAQAYWIANSTVVTAKGSSFSTLKSNSSQSTWKLPFLCTQSVQQDQPEISNASSSNQVSVIGGTNTYTGYRNQKSFRFLGIKYAAFTERFTYSSILNRTGQSVQATEYGPFCTQYGAGSEDCLYLNVQTPYLPKARSKKKLRPVLFWIYGGGFVNGKGNDPAFDGGNLASREDIVVVTINYRVNTYGFLAIPGTDIKGNFGIGDQINALQWVIANIAAFGGDPDQITIAGQSAGAGSVRALLGSPKAIGKFQGAIAMSNLGGGVDLGLTSNSGTTYSSYVTINESYAQAGQQIFQQAGCTQSDVTAQVACLRAYTGDLTLLGTSARFIVQDGSIVDRPELDVRNKNPVTANVPVIFGNARDDGADFAIAYSQTCTSEVACLEANLGVTQQYAQSIIDSGLFPSPNTGNITADAFNVSSHVLTDNTFRCIDQATAYAGATSGAFKAAYYYQTDRCVEGWNPQYLDVTGAITPALPYGDPSTPYYRVHSCDLAWLFGDLEGTLGHLRDENDLWSQQVSTGYVGAFVKAGDPNPPIEYLEARGYDATLQAVKTTGTWDKVSGEAGPIRRWDYPPESTQFVDLKQCEWLKYPIDYYFQRGS